MGEGVLCRCLRCTRVVWSVLLGGMRFVSEWWGWVGELRISGGEWGGEVVVVLFGVVAWWFSWGRANVLGGCWSGPPNPKDAGHSACG